MEIAADLHIHSKHSQGTSNSLNLEKLEKYARIKGLDLLGTGDFTHPKWIEELKTNLTEDGSGILTSKTGFNFVLQTEISLIYSQDGRGRKVHNIVLAPNFEVVDQITEALLKRGRVDYDGRPIFGIPCPEFVEMLKEISPKIEVIPAHIYTPWFSLFGSKSGFDSVQDCFKDQTKHIHALETGLSSDPAMCWRISQLDKYTLISNSDLHSFWPWRIGRECNIFDIDMSYKSLLNVLKTKEGFKETIEFWPAEGKYHFDGHRKCDVCLNPSDTMKLKGICPKCGKPLTIGVAYRVEELADRPEGFRPKDAVDFKNLIPLSELIAGVMGVKQVASQKVWKIYNLLIERFKDEINVLLNVPEEELKKAVNPEITEVIIKNRQQKIYVSPGYDGEYGIPIFDEKEAEKLKQKKTIKIRRKQTGLTDFD